MRYFIVWYMQSVHNQNKSDNHWCKYSYHQAFSWIAFSNLYLFTYFHEDLLVIMNL